MRILLDKYFSNATAYTLLSNPKGNAFINKRELFLTGNNRNETYDITIIAGNSNGNITSKLTIFEYIPLPIVKLDLSNIETTSVLRNSEFRLDLSNHFDDFETFSVKVVESGSDITSDNRVIIVGNDLVIYPNYRNTTYDVVVIATNLGGSKESKLHVTELISPPEIITQLSTLDNNYNNVSSLPPPLNLKTYFRFINTVETHVYERGILIEDDNRVFVNNNILIITPNFRAVPYNINVIVSNASGSVTSTLSVREVPKAPALIKDLITAYNLTNETKQIELKDYFTSIEHIDITIKEYNVVIENDDIYFLSDTLLTLNPMYRNKSYTIDVAVSNMSGIVSSTIFVSELDRPIELGAELSVITKAKKLKNIPYRVDLLLFIYGMDIVTIRVFKDGNYIDNDGRAYVTGTILNIIPNYRNTSYEIHVTASDYISNVESILYVSELHPPPVSIKGFMLPKHIYDLTTEPYIINLSYHYMYIDVISVEIIESGNVVTNDGRVVLNGVVLTIIPNFRGITYILNITLSNESGSVLFSIETTEIEETLHVKKELSTIQETDKLTHEPYVVRLNDYFSAFESVTIEIKESNNVIENDGRLNLFDDELTIYPNYRNTSYQIKVTAYNGIHSVSSTLYATELINPPFNIIDLTTVEETLILKNDIFSLDLSHYFAYISLIDVRLFNIVSDTNVYFDNDGRIEISDTLLKIIPNFRDTTYYVKVIISNESSSIYSVLTVTELVKPPEAILDFSLALQNITLNDEEHVIDLTQYFSNIASAHIEITNVSRSSIDSSDFVFVRKTELSIIPNYRNISYTIVVTVYNDSGVLSSELDVTEPSHPTNMTKMLSSVTNAQYLGDNTYNLILTPYFGKYDHVTYNVIQNGLNMTQYGRVDLSNDVLIIYPNYRDVSYEVSITAYKGSTYKVSSLYVRELKAKPVINKQIPDVYDLTDQMITINLKNYCTSIENADVKISLNGIDYYTRNTIVYVNNYTFYYIPNYRNKSYFIRIVVKSGKGEAKIIFKVHELEKPPSLLGKIPNITLTNKQYEIDLSLYIYRVKNIEILEENTNIVKVNDTLLKINPDFRNKTYDIRILSSNSGGTLLSKISITEFMGYPKVTKSLLLVNNTHELRDTLYKLNLKDHFSNIQNTSTRIRLNNQSQYYSNKNVAYIDGYYLYYKPNYRNQVYDVKVTVYNTFDSVSSILQMTELAAPPILKTSLDTVKNFANLTNADYALDLSLYFDNVTNPSVVVTDSVNDNRATINDTTLIIHPNYRNTSYNVEISMPVYNGDNVRSFLTVTETMLPPELKVDLSTLDLSSLTDEQYKIDMNDYFKYIGKIKIATKQSGVLVNDSRAVISGVYLYINPSYRGVDYTVDVFVSNNSGLKTSTLFVKELSPESL